MISIQDLIDRFGETEIINLSDHDSYKQINETVVMRAINDATALIESYLNPTGLFSRQDGKLVYKYATHQTPMPSILITKACDIARYHLSENGATEIVETRYKQAIDWLKQVANNPKMLTGDKSAITKSTVVVMPNPKPSIYQD